MDSFNNPTTYESIPNYNYDSSELYSNPPLQFSNQYYTSGDDFTDHNVQPYDFGSGSMPVFTTPGSLGPVGRGVIPTDSSYITPHSQAVTAGPAYLPYGNSMFTDTSAEEQGEPFVAYRGESHSFSDGTDDYKTEATSTAASKPRGMLPTPPPSFTTSSIPAAVPVATLQFNNFQEAEAEASGRTLLGVDQDDWHRIASNKKLHVAIIMGAFDVPFRAVPNVALTAAEKERWVKYQTEQNDKTLKYLSKNPFAKETAAWMLLETLLDVHKLGYKRGLRVMDPEKTCSDRFIQMVRAISNYAVIRFDIVRMLRFDDLATSPAHVVARKVANWRGNCHKVKRDELNREAAAEAGVEYKAVLGAKRKYKPIEPRIAEGSRDTSAYESSFDGSRDSKKRKSATDDVDGEYTPSTTPSKLGRKRGTVVAGPDN